MNATSWHINRTFQHGRTGMSAVYRLAIGFLLIHLLWYGRPPSFGKSTTSHGFCYCYRLGTFKPSINAHLYKSIPRFSLDEERTLGDDTEILRGHSNVAIHEDNASDVCNTKNVIAQLTGVEDRLKWLRGTCTNIKDHPSASGIKVLYLVNGDASISYFQERLNEDGDFSKAINYISRDKVKVDKDAPVTITTFDFIDGCCSFLHDGGHYGNGDIDANASQPFLSQFIANYGCFEDDKASNLKHFVKDTLVHFFEPRSVLDSESIPLDNIPLKLDSHVYTPILERVNEMYTDVDLLAKGFSGSDSIVFDFSTTGRGDVVGEFCEVLNSVLCKIRRHHRLLFFFEDLFFSWQFENWLKSLYGETTTVTFSRPPSFSTFTSRGSFDLYSNDKPIPSLKFSRAINRAVSHSVDPLVYAQNSLCHFTFFFQRLPINRQFDAHSIDVVLEALKNKGITTRGQLAHFSKTAHSIVRDVEGKAGNLSLLTGDTNNGLRGLLACMMDSNRYKLLSPLIRCCNLLDDVGRLELPTAPDIIDYIKEKQLYPTSILTKFKDISKDQWAKEFMKFPVDQELCEALRKHGIEKNELFSRGIAVIGRAKSSNELRLFLAWYPHLFKIIISDRSLSFEPKHLLVMRDFLGKTILGENVNLLSRTKKAKLATFCGGLFDSMLHVAARLQHPISPYMGTIPQALIRTINSMQNKTQKTFRHYMQHASSLYYEQIPDFAKDRVTVSFELTRLEKEVDADCLKHFMHLRTCCGHFAKMFRRFKKIVNFVSASKAWALCKLLQKASLLNSTVLGIDGNKYIISRILNNHSDVSSWSFSDDCKAVINDLLNSHGSTLLLMSNLDMTVYYVTPLGFIKDILALSDSTEPVPLANDVKTLKNSLDVTTASLGFTEAPPSVNMPYLTITTQPCDASQYEMPLEIPATQFCPSYVIEAAKKINALVEPLKNELAEMYTKVPQDETSKRWLQLAQVNPIGGMERRRLFAKLFKDFWGVAAPA